MRERSRAAGDIFSRRVLKLLGIARPPKLVQIFLSNSLQVLIEQTVGNGNESVVPLGIACLVSTYQQQRRAPGIERKQNSKLPRANFPAQLFHVRMAGTRNYISVGTSQSRTMLLQKFDLRVDFRLLLFRKRVPPSLELGGVFNRPRHDCRIPYEEYSVQRKPCVDVSVVPLFLSTTYLRPI